MPRWGSINSPARKPDSFTGVRWPLISTSLGSGHWAVHSTLIMASCCEYATLDSGKRNGSRSRFAADAGKDTWLAATVAPTPAESGSGAA